MASNNGKTRSFNRHQTRVFRMAAKNTPEYIRRQHVATQRRQLPWMPSANDVLDTQRQEVLLTILLDPQVAHAQTFGIIWTPNCPWACGDSIMPFAHIFDRFVKDHWTVEVSHQLGETSATGWLFIRA